MAGTGDMAIPLCRTARKRSAQARSWKPGRRRQPSGARERWKPDRGETRVARLDALRARQRDRPLLRWPGTPERKVAFTMTPCPRQNTPIPTIPWNTCSSARRPCTNGSTNCSTTPSSTALHAARQVAGHVPSRQRTRNSLACFDGAEYADISRQPDAAAVKALTRAMWLIYVAPETAIEKLSAPLTREAEQAAKNLPSAKGMIDQIGKRVDRMRRQQPIRCRSTSRASPGTP